MKHRTPLSCSKLCCAQATQRARHIGALDIIYPQLSATLYPRPQVLFVEDVGRPVARTRLTPSLEACQEPVQRMDHERECPPHRTFDSAFDVGRIQLTHLSRFSPSTSPSDSLFIPVIFDALKVARKTGCINSFFMIGSTVFQRQSAVVPMPDRKVW